jgi:hypothetical protein
MKTFVEFISECYLILEERGGKPKYSDEYANINFYNYLVSSPDVRELIRNQDYEAVNKIITKELESAKSDPKHVLHFNNASDEGFPKKTKDDMHKQAYYSELDRAAPGFLSLIQDKKGRNIASKGWIGRVAGGDHEPSKSSWKGNVKGQGRFDYVFSDPDDPKKQHRVSGKDYRGSQAGSAQADQATATLARGVEVSVQKQMKDFLASKPKIKDGETQQEYKERLAQRKLTAREKKAEILATAKEKTDKIKELMASTKGLSPEQQKDVYTKVQAQMDELETMVPGTKRASGQEMVQGTGQFAKSKTAQSIWTTGGEGSFKDPRQQSVGLRARAGKGSGREMAVAGDIKASVKEKEEQKKRQSSFTDFSRQASQALQNLAAAEKESSAANKIVGPGGQRVLRQHQATYLQNNPEASQQYTQRKVAAQAAVQSAQTDIQNIQQQQQTPPPEQQQATKPTIQQPQPIQTSPSRQPQQTQTSRPEQQQQTQSEPEKKTEDSSNKRRKETRDRMNAAGQAQGFPN